MFQGPKLQLKNSVNEKKPAQAPAQYVTQLRRRPM